MSKTIFDQITDKLRADIKDMRIEIRRLSMEIERLEKQNHRLRQELESAEKSAMEWAEAYDRQYDE